MQFLKFLLVLILLLLYVGGAVSLLAVSYFYFNTGTMLVGLLIC